jgi:hypothetical protein
MDSLITADMILQNGGTATATDVATKDTTTQD